VLHGVCVERMMITGVLHFVCDDDDDDRGVTRCVCRGVGARCWLALMPYPDRVAC